MIKRFVANLGEKRQWVLYSDSKTIAKLEKEIENEIIKSLWKSLLTQKTKPLS